MGQTALYNNGNIRIHQEGNLGFHTNLINESPFDTNLGLAGFYSTNNITISGTIVPLFYDMEIATENGLQLELGVDNANNINFILGDIITPKSDNTVYFNFLDASFYTGVTDLAKVNCYAAITNKSDFLFPVGDATFLRPLELSSESSNSFAKCAYFFENPNSSNSLNQSFDTTELGRELELVSAAEFWQLEGTVPSTITINWNERSNLSNLTDDATQIVPVGWSKISQRWLSLGTSSVVGSVTDGFVTSETFIPDDYDIIGFGVSKISFENLEKEILTLDNFIVSANGDGINDSFYVEELEQSPNNMVRVYDRYGLKVFEKANYINEFVGTSNINNFVISREDGLPEGVYFFTIDMLDLDLSYQGFLYLAR
jgi:gliding motility-associated-like protein